MALFGGNLGRSGAAQRKNIVGFFVEGDVALQNMLLNLEPKVFNRVMKTATAKAMTPVGKAARNRVRSVSQTVAKAIRKKTKTYKRSGTVVTIVGVSSDRRYVVSKKRRRINWRSQLTDQTRAVKTDPTKIAHLIEYGTKAHKITARVGTGVLAGVFRKQADHPGAQAHPFMRPAWDANKGRVLQNIKTFLGPAIVREARKLAAKGDTSVQRIARKGGLEADEAV